MKKDTKEERERHTHTHTREEKSFEDVARKRYHMYVVWYHGTLIYTYTHTKMKSIRCAGCNEEPPSVD